MDAKAKELWEEKYGDANYAFDFANKLIIKSEYKTKSPFSWTIDIYDFGDEASFIAHTETIKLRDHKPVFEIDGLKYIITQNPNYSYSIISPSKISDEKCPINFDLFLNSKINNYAEQNYSFVIVTIKKMNKDIANIFLSFIVDYFKGFKQFISFNIDDSNFARTEIKFQFLNDEKFTSSDAFEIAVTSSTLMPLIIHRLSSLEQKVWKIDEEFEQEHYYNVFFVSQKMDENYYPFKDIKITEMITMFENTIFLDEKTKNEITEYGTSKNGFEMTKNSVEEGFYQYRYSRTDIAKYNDLVLSKAK
ncbi:MAG: hypothetical protein ACRCXE_03965 [Metamycoplasmataceae bacterium]